jgi:hypothetical protein
MDASKAPNDAVSKWYILQNSTILQNGVLLQNGTILQNGAMLHQNDHHVLLSIKWVKI